MIFFPNSLPDARYVNGCLSTRILVGDKDRATDLTIIVYLPGIGNGFVQREKVTQSRPVATANDFLRHVVPAQGGPVLYASNRLLGTGQPQE